MCLGVPMEVIEVTGLAARCRHAGGAEDVNLALTGAVTPGCHVLVHLGSAIRVLDATEARQIADALQAVTAAVRGENFEHLLADLIDREPTLPDGLVSSQTKSENGENDHGSGDY